MEYTIIVGQPVASTTRTSRLVDANGVNLTYEHLTYGTEGTYVSDHNGNANWFRSFADACRWVAQRQDYIEQRAAKRALISRLLAEYHDNLRNL